MLKDSQIISSIKEGRNQEILSTLYREILPEIKRFVKKNGGSTDQAEDVFQEAVVALIMSVKEGRFKEGNSIRAYLKTIVRNKWFDQFKAKLKEEEAVSNSYREAQIPEKKISEEQKNAIDVLLKSLGEQCEKLLKMSVFYGHSYADIAEMFEMNSEDVVKTTMYRCRKKMKEKVSKNPKLINQLQF